MTPHGFGNDRTVKLLLDWSNYYMCTGPNGRITTSSYWIGGRFNPTTRSPEVSGVVKFRPDRFSRDVLFDEMIIVFCSPFHQKLNPAHSVPPPLPKRTANLLEPQLAPSREGRRPRGWSSRKGASVRMVATGSCPERRTGPGASRPLIGGVRAQLFKQRPTLQGDLVSATSAVRGTR